MYTTPEKAKIIQGEIASIVAKLNGLERLADELNVKDWKHKQILKRRLREAQEPLVGLGAAPFFNKIISGEYATDCQGEVKPLKESAR